MKPPAHVTRASELLTGALSDAVQLSEVLDQAAASTGELPPAARAALAGALFSALCDAADHHEVVATWLRGNEPADDKAHPAADEADLPNQALGRHEHYGLPHYVHVVIRSDEAEERPVTIAFNTMPAAEDYVMAEQTDRVARGEKRAGYRIEQWPVR